MKTLLLALPAAICLVGGMTAFYVVVRKARQRR
jgi:hypothetical protein